MIFPPHAVGYVGGIEIMKLALSISTALEILRLLQQLYICWPVIVYDRHHIEFLDYRIAQFFSTLWYLSDTQPGETSIWISVEALR